MNPNITKSKGYEVLHYWYHLKNFTYSKKYLDKFLEDLKNKKILVLGLSTTGFAAAKFLLRAGADCFLSDSKDFPKDPDDIKKAEFLKENGAKLEFKGHTEDFIKNATGGFSASDTPYDIGFFIDKVSGLYIIPFLGTFNEIMQQNSLENIE